MEMLMLTLAASSLWWTEVFSHLEERHLSSLNLFINKSTAPWSTRTSSKWCNLKMMTLVRDSWSEDLTKRDRESVIRPLKMKPNSASREHKEFPLRTYLLGKRVFPQSLSSIQVVRLTIWKRSSRTGHFPPQFRATTTSSVPLLKNPSPTPKKDPLTLNGTGNLSCHQGTSSQMSLLMTPSWIC